MIFFTPRKRRLLLLLILFIYVLAVYYSRRNTLATKNFISNKPIQDEKIPEKFEPPKRLSDIKSSWKYIYGDGTKRDTVIELRGACLTRNNKLFLPNLPNEFSNLSIPSISVAGSDKSVDQTIQVETNKMSQSEKEQAFVAEYNRDKDLFVLGTVWSFHMTHFFQNNVMPLNNVLWYYNGMENNFTKWRRKDLLVVGGASFFDMKALNSERIFDINGEQSSEALICYDRAIVGLNSTCDCCGCEKDYSSISAYNITREIVLHKHLTVKELKAARIFAQKPLKERRFHLIIIDRLNSRRILNLDQIKKYLDERKTSYEIVNLEGKSFSDQVRMFSTNATMILASHGNALGSAFWMAPGSVVVEVHAYGQGSQIFEHLFNDANKVAGSNLKNIFEYKIMKCKDESCKDPHSNGFNSDVKVSIEKLDFLLDQYDKH